MVDSSSGKLGITPLIPDLNSSVSHVTGIVHRYGCEMPHGDVNLRKEFLAFAKSIIPLKFKPPELPAKTSLEMFEDWLEHTPYNGSRKDYLRRLRQEIANYGVSPNQLKEIVDSLAFTKLEGWDEPKWPRMINSPSDYTKVILGPVVYAIDKATYDSANHNSHFVKGKDPRTWPQMLLDLFGDDPVAETDFTSMEAHHIGEMCDAVHYWMMHMMRNMPYKSSEKRLISRMMRGVNTSKFATCTAKVDQRLMSGVLWTSSANGVLNLLLMLFLKHYDPSLSRDEVVGRALLDNRVRVEGDDGITAIDARGAEKMTKMAEKLGLRLTLEAHADFTEAKFCSMICDSRELIVLPDPVKVLRKFFVLPPAMRDMREQAHFAMMRAKAMSYAYLFHDTPIIGALAHRVCELTRSYSVSASLTTGMWQWQFVESALSEEGGKDKWLKTRPVVSMTSRLLVEKRFGVSVHQQLLMERQIYETGPQFDVMCDNFRGKWDDEYQRVYVCNMEPDSLPLTYLPAQVRTWLEEGISGKSSKTVLNFSKRSLWAGEVVEPVIMPGGA